MTDRRSHPRRLRRALPFGITLIAGIVLAGCQPVSADDNAPGVSAADLAVFTSRSVPKKQDESKLSADQYWHAHPELSEERYRPHRAAAYAESLRRAKAEVERFLASKIGLQYEKIMATATYCCNTCPTMA